MNSNLNILKFKMVYYMAEKFIFPSVYNKFLWQEGDKFNTKFDD